MYGWMNEHIEKFFQYGKGNNDVRTAHRADKLTLIEIFLTTFFKQCVIPLFAESFYSRTSR